MVSLVQYREFVEIRNVMVHFAERRLRDSSDGMKNTEIVHGCLEKEREKTYHQT